MLRRQAAKPQVRLGEGSKVINTLRWAATRLPAFFLCTGYMMPRGLLQVSAGFCRPMVQKPPRQKVRKLKGFGACLQAKEGFCTFCTILCACFYETGIVRLIDWKMLGYCL